MADKEPKGKGIARIAKIAREGDTEGHIAKIARADEDPKGQGIARIAKIAREGEDTEGHIARIARADEGSSKGIARIAREGEGDDTEGHIARIAKIAKVDPPTLDQ